MNPDQILKYSLTFKKLSDTNIDNAIKNIGYAIQREVAGGINAINKLITSSKDAANSHGLMALDDAFGKIGDTARELNKDSINVSVKFFKNQIGNALFFTSSYNAGTGYDPITHKGGAQSPASYLNRINSLVSSLEKMGLT